MARAQQTPVKWHTWLTLALILFLAGHTGYVLVQDGRWFTAMLIALIYPIGGAVQWWVWRRSADPPVAHAYDRDLPMIMVAQLLFAMLTVWR
ncbi:hypothetical protein [Enhygromyxa salina]|uniref:Uncharacterized protein n=1 Tax=Enhygromyxa salina TaxID=215803 RepID=A0A2S9YYC0_9BACT|nr:hypothetical protein [Enhygromyxa salina]PRQ10072.1 hypothetical protein ENSA7_02780 [Enhygromyxa salina]